MVYLKNNTTNSFYRLIFLIIFFSFIFIEYAKSSFLDPQQELIINSVNNYLNNLSHMEGDFYQINPDNSSHFGKFYIRRPGKFRFDYESPSSLLVVSDSVWLGVTERDLKTFNRYPIRYSPHYALFKEDVDLINDARILSLELFPKLLILSIEGNTGEEIGEITLHFKINESNEKTDLLNLDLEQWFIVDAQGTETNVKLSNIAYGIETKHEYFVVRKPE
ncbi:outer membrane lipoprotein carrier protein LolA [Hyphomicrobiales bacterium]|nr:outer membrane lipoprotein carrier protein LolA [Hyphomicrobiales bacterium]